jgi:alkanesulfonate monooxygenase SsuD/methylene tetrahydromethanopterin reductase-like flavin-dependent oxidoreductase (luciferase family)
MKKLWTTSPAEHQGVHYSFGPIRCEPRPVQRPHPPIWIGGHSDAALARAARHGDGWHPLGAVEPEPLAPPELAQKLDTLKRLTEAAGRDFSKLTLSFVGRLNQTAAPAAGAGRKLFTGSASQIADDVAAYAKLGVSEIIFDFRTPSLPDTLARMDRFAADVMTLTG